VGTPSPLLKAQGSPSMGRGTYSGDKAGNLAGITNFENMDKRHASDQKRVVSPQRNVSMGLLEELELLHSRMVKAQGPQQTAAIQVELEKLQARVSAAAKESPKGRDRLPNQMPSDPPQWC